MNDDPVVLADVRRVLEAFQAGYDRRDTAQLDAFMQLFSEDAELEVIGTGALTPGVDEWCLGPQAVRELVEADWLTWGDLTLDLAGARIHSLGDTAWLATRATVSQRIATDQACGNLLAYIPDISAQPRPAEEKLLRIMLACANTLYELRRGESFTWPLRFTALLTHEADGAWRFRQMQFAYATTRWPDEREM